MLNYIWAGMMIFSFVVAAMGGNVGVITEGVAKGCKDSVELCASLLGIMCFWTGLAKIAENSGLIGVFARVLRPIMRLLFPKLKADGAAARAIVMNIVANFFGMGNAATPLGINAMKELDKLNEGDEASDEMCTFAVINTASFQLIPSTLISLRQAFGSTEPGIVIVPVWIVSILAIFAAVGSAKIYEKRRKP